MRFGMRKLIAVIIAIALAIAVIAASFNVYFNLEESKATALWNDKEVQLFIGTRSIGHRVSTLWLSWFLLKSRLGAVEDPDDDHGSLDTIKVTPSAVEHHVLKLDYRNPTTGADMYTPLDGHIYANDPALGGLCRWVDDRFEPVTPEERQRLDGINRLTNKDIDHNQDGWSKHSFAVGPGDINDTFTIAVGDNFKLSLSDVAMKSGGRRFSIDLLRSGHSPEKIWSRELQWGRVNKTEYRRVFEQRE